MIDADFLTQFHKMTRDPVVPIHGRMYSHEQLHLVPSDTRPAPIAFGTLQGLVEYIGANPDGLAYDKLLLHVCSPERVQLVGAVSGDDSGRTVHAFAQLDEKVKRFKFDEFMPTEAFNIGLQALFVKTQERDAVLQKTGTMKADKVVTATDDGITQRITAAAGVALVATVELPNPVQLKPFRTFREIDQPESAFILRVKDNSHEGELPLCALFQADGEAWRFEAVETIQTHLNGLIGELDEKTHCIPVVI